MDTKLKTYMYYINGNERQPNGNRDNKDNLRTKTIAECKDGQIQVIVVVHLRKVDLKKKKKKKIPKNSNFKIFANERQLRPLAVVTLSLVPFSPSSLCPLVHQLFEREKKVKGSFFESFKKALTCSPGSLGWAE